MTRAALLLVLLACLGLASAYVSQSTYYAFGDLTTSQVTTGSASTVTGTFLVIYEASSMSFKYRLISNAPAVGTVNLNGPSRCWSVPNRAFLSDSDANCVINTAPVIQVLGQGASATATPTGKTSFQYFEGTLGFSATQEAMFFDGELYFEINTQLQGTDGKFADAPLLRGRVRPFDNPMSPMGNTNLFGYLVFSGDAGSFGATSTKTSNSGFGVITHNPSTPTLSIKIYTTIPAGNTGTYSLKCPSGVKSLDNNNNAGNNPLIGQVQLVATDTSFLSDIWTKSCYIFITSSANPTGELFSAINPVGTFEVLATGQKLNPVVSSGYFAYFTITFDAGSKYMSIYCTHNITTTVTSVKVIDADSTPLCELVANNKLTCLTNPNYCYLNQTSLTNLQNGKIQIVVSTSGNPAGEVGGPVALNGKGSILAAGSSNNSLAIGLGIGLGLGIPLLILLVVAIFFFLKNRSSKGI